MKCPSCNTVLQLEDGDKPRFDDMNRPMGKGCVITDCPVCGEAIHEEEALMRKASTDQPIPPNEDSESPEELLKQYYEFQDALREAEGARDVYHALSYSTYVFLSGHRIWSNKNMISLVICGIGAGIGIGVLLIMWLPAIKSLITVH